MRLNWNKAPRLFSEGLDRGVLYSKGTGVPWNGLISVQEQEVGEVYTDYYLDGTRIRATQNLGDFTATLEAYTYPDEFDDVGLVPFGLSYRTHHSDRYLIHMVYNALATPSSRLLRTMGGQAEPSTFLWDISSMSANIPGSSPAAHLVLDASDTPEVTESLENLLYGTETEDATLPDPSVVLDICEAAATLKITYNGDGTWTADGPDDMVQVHPDGSFTISSPSLFLQGDGRFVVSSH